MGRTRTAWEVGKVTEARNPERFVAAGPRRRLAAGKSYFDLDHPEQGPFVATGDEELAPGANIVAQEDVSEEAWLRLVSNGFGESETGVGDRAYDQGAFGQEDDPRSNVLNAAPPGVGEGLTPEETEEEKPRG